MLENLKKNWFVVLVAIALLAVIGSYGVSQAQSVFKGKTVDGKQVVFEIDGKDIFAEDYYGLLDDSFGDAELFRLFKRQLLTAIDTSDAIKTEAKTLSDNYRQQIAANQGQPGLDALGKKLIAQGYTGLDELTTYFEDSLKQDDIIRSYFIANYDSIFKDFVATQKPRKVSHILIKFADNANPTEDELAKVAKVEEQLAAGTDFGEVALNNSEDTATAVERGSLGVVDKDSSFVAEFLEAMLKLNKGEVSGWVTTQYGRHLIKADETDFKVLLEDDTYFATIVEKYSSDAAKALWNESKKLNIEFNDSTVEARLIKYLGLESEGE